MADIVQIDIQSVSIEKQMNKKYMVLLDWEIQQSAGAEYNGPYYLILCSLGAVTAYPVIQTYTNRSGYTANLPMETSKIIFYTVSLSTRAEKPYTSCKAVPVTPLEYMDLKTIYDGQNLKINFTPPLGINGGEITLLSEGRPASLHNLDARARYLHIKMEAGEFLPDEAIVCSLRAKMASNSYGPKTSHSLIFSGIPRAESVGISGEEISVSCVIPDYVFLHKLSCFVNLSLYQGMEEVWTVSPISLAGIKSASGTFSWNVSGWGDALGGFNAVIYITTTTGENRSIKENLIPLSYPVPRTELKGKDIHIIWEGKPWERFQVLPPTGNPVEVTGSIYNIPAAEELDGEVRVVAVTYIGKHKIVGPYSQGAALFKPGFYPVMGEEIQLCLYQKAFGEETVSLYFGPDFLPKEVDTIISAPFQVMKNMDGWQFIIDRSNPMTVTREKFEEFLADLKIAGLLPSGEYNLRRGMAHSGCVSIKDSLWYLNHMEKNGRYADLFPGACLKTELADYQPQLSEHVDDSGYIKGAVSRYTVGLGIQDGKESLQFDGNLEYVLGGWPDASTDSNVLPGAGGLVDFFCKSMRKPYARLYYPEAFHSSRKPGSFYAMDNFCLAVLEDVNLFPEDLSGLACSGLTYLILRGRSTVTVEISVIIGGGVEWVPLGTTIGDMARRLGLPSSRGLSILRQTGGETGPLPVYLERITPGKADGFPLMMGDWILGGPKIPRINRAAYFRWRNEALRALRGILWGYEAFYGVMRMRAGSFFSTFRRLGQKMKNNLFIFKIRFTQSRRIY